GDEGDDAQVHDAEDVAILERGLPREEAGEGDRGRTEEGEAVTAAQRAVEVPELGHRLIGSGEGLLLLGLSLAGDRLHRRGRSDVRPVVVVRWGLPVA